MPANSSRTIGYLNIRGGISSVFEAEADSFILTGDVNLPEGSSEPRFVVNGNDEVFPEVGLPTRGRAKNFWYVDRHDSLGYRAAIPVDKSIRFNDISLSYRDEESRVTERPVVRFPSDKRLQHLIPSAKELTRIIGPTPFSLRLLYRRRRYRGYDDPVLAEESI